MNRKDAYLLVITTSILILAWIVITIFNSANNSTIDDNLTTQIVPIQPTFDEKTINLLKGRTQVVPQNTLENTDEASTAATPTVEPTPEDTAISSSSAIQQITP